MQAQWMSDNHDYKLFILYFLVLFDLNYENSWYASAEIYLQNMAIYRYNEVNRKSG